MDLSDRTALVPGDAEFVGSHIAKALFDSGTEVVVADDMSVGRRRWVPDGARFLETDLSARADVKRAVTADVDIVF